MPRRRTELNTFLSCLDSGWVQAFGSIAAIAAGWFYVAKQNKDQIERTQKQLDASVLERLRILIAIFASLFEELQRTAANIRKGEILVNLEARRLDSYQHRLMTIPIFDIPDYGMARCLEQIISSLHIAQASLNGISSFEEREPLKIDKFRQAMELTFHVASDSVVRGFLYAGLVGKRLASDFLPDDVGSLMISTRGQSKTCVETFMDYLSSTKG